METQTIVEKALASGKAVRADNIPESTCVYAGATVHPSATIGKKVLVLAGARVGAGVTLKDHVIVGNDVYIGANSYVGKGTRIWDNANVGNEVTLGKNVCLMEGVRVARWVKVGNNTRIEANAQIEENTTLGADCFVEVGLFVGGYAGLRPGTVVRRVRGLS